MVDPMFDLALLGSEQVRPLHRREYEDLIKLGAFTDERVELLRGVLVEMSPQGHPHARITAWIAQSFSRALDIARYEVRSHSPYAASVDSMPEPDVAVSRRTQREGHPNAALLLVEVSETSLVKDRKIKTEIYAEAGVPEYWIVNTPDRTVEVRTLPGPAGYGHVVTRSAKDLLRPLKLRGLELCVSEIPWTARKPRTKRG